MKEPNKRKQKQESTGSGRWKKRKGNECSTEEVPEFSDSLKNEGQMVAQPKLLTGETMREYQIEGLDWLIGLHETHNLNGILGQKCIVFVKYSQRFLIVF